LSESSSLVLIEIPGAGREIWPPELRCNGLIQLLVFVRCNLRIPVSASHTMPSLEQTFEEVSGRGVDHDLGEVLAADKEHVVDA
jgi:hypothetical protein